MNRFISIVLTALVAIYSGWLNSNSISLRFLCNIGAVSDPLKLNGSISVPIKSTGLKVIQTPLEIISYLFSLIYTISQSCRFKLIFQRAKF